MNRAKVTVHMYVSIDGKIDGKYMEEHGCDASGDFYDEEIFRMSKANANGANTVAMYAAEGKSFNPDDYDTTGIIYEDWRGDVQSETWDISFDRKGRCLWETNIFEYGGKKSRVIEVVTEKAPLAYLAFLRTMDIPYIIAGKEEMDIPLALEKLKKEFGLEAITLAGGAIINGAFLKAGCVDEISLVIAPYVSGEDEKVSFDTLGTFIPQKFTFKKAVPMEDGGVQLIFTKE